MSFELALNTGTTPRLSLAEALAATRDAGLGHIGLWRNRIQEVGLERAAELVAESGLRVTSLCRGGFLTAAEPAEQRAALADNRTAIDECVAVGTDQLIMVVGGLPTGDRDLVAARRRVRDRLVDLVPYAAERGVQLVLEPLHPMYCGDRAVLSTLGQALDLADGFDPSVVSVVVDAFHVWWDPEVGHQIARAGREGRLAAYQVCDFNLPIAADALLSRGMMGDGVIDFGALSAMVAGAGYTGPVEVEIFNAEIYARPADEVLTEMTGRYRDLVLPHLTGAGQPART
ncbi:sugar phosphate isomerase/epimerase family protein [Enemella evansiae]|uniref:Xylose isomerase n=1 Tax=Enemella evansiae TaxID=2016499 RepID=A0A255G741_9ACTN|nr:sugar phosphate isomerase/epimerase [Enemella evansiae]OYN99711.1 xylose isomerase [Enemella evansiae]OYO00185.1 xylose isomerase [Enemella evansiae]OYO09098.1 xylose isomerase [Enemella evansiae]OYO11757.1 xylose isomerase [Enemella evansiae]